MEVGRDELPSTAARRIAARQRLRPTSHIVGCCQASLCVTPLIAIDSARPLTKETRHGLALPRGPLHIGNTAFTDTSANSVNVVVVGVSRRPARRPPCIIARPDAVRGADSAGPFTRHLSPAQPHPIVVLMAMRLPRRLDTRRRRTASVVAVRSRSLPLRPPAQLAA